MVTKIVSGGQTGVDQGALDFALKKNISCGGWCPKGRLSENGIIPKKYPLSEIKNSSYKLRTKKNVLDSDGTLIVVKNNNIGNGTKLTIKYCKKYRKPFLFIDLDIFENKFDRIKKEFKDWIISKKILILNVAGSREIEAIGIQIKTIDLLNYLFY